mmetsp:Transcript_28283/g.46489  ORF Transcript_28283/g.46489 Transcript_28283/m.46489 type:complete len:310 (+) Transcript_28283:1642-2571(+)
MLADAKVSHFDALDRVLLAAEYILWLQIAMHNALLVHMVDGSSYLMHHMARDWLRVRLTRKRGQQVAALAQLHHEIQVLLGLINVVQLNNAWLMPQLLHDGDLVRESLSILDLLLVDHFDGHSLACRSMLGGNHRCATRATANLIRETIHVSHFQSTRFLDDCDPFLCLVSRRCLKMKSLLLATDNKTTASAICRRHGRVVAIFATAATAAAFIHNNGFTFDRDDNREFGRVNRFCRQQKVVGEHKIIACWCGFMIMIVHVSLVCSILGKTRLVWIMQRCRWRLLPLRLFRRLRFASWLLGRNHRLQKT